MGTSTPRHMDAGVSVPKFGSTDQKTYDRKNWEGSKTNDKLFQARKVINVSVLPAYL